MNCYDCSIDGTTLPAVAVCHDCGAAVCTNHAITTVRRVTRMVPLGRRIPAGPAARTVRCVTCDAAATAVA